MYENLYVYRGCTFDCSISLVDKKQNPYFLAKGDRLIFGVKDSLTVDTTSNTEPEDIIRKELTMDDAIAGKYCFKLSPEETCLPTRRYYYYAAIELADGDRYQIAPYSEFNVKMPYVLTNDRNYEIIGQVPRIMRRKSCKSIKEQILDYIKNVYSDDNYVPVRIRNFGHLDIMRYFQKAMRRAGIDIRYSEGMSPHMIMSFALPLSVGQTSDCEYMDVELNTPISREEALSRLNSVMAEGIRVTDMIQAAEGKAGKAMSLVSAADYRVKIRDAEKTPEEYRHSWQQMLDHLGLFLTQSDIEVTKEGKDGLKNVNIRPLILDMHQEEDSLFLRVRAGSQANLKPGAAIRSCLDFLDLSMPEYILSVNREEVYADVSENGEHKLVPLGELGI